MELETSDVQYLICDACGEVQGRKHKLSQQFVFLFS